MNTQKNKQTQSDVQLRIMQQIEQEVPDLELESIIDDQTIDNELNYLLSLQNPDNKDSKLKETLAKISEEDLF